MEIIICLFMLAVGFILGRFSLVKKNNELKDELSKFKRDNLIFMERKVKTNERSSRYD